MISYKKFPHNVAHCYIDETAQSAHSTHTLEYVAESEIERIAFDFHFNEFITYD